jgi:F-type H+-transporting ATPase subunit gamma
MSKRAQIQRHLGMLDDIGGIMGAMKNISLMETHKLARFLAYQHRVLASVEAAATDFLSHHPEIVLPVGPAVSGVIVAIGSQRGFCGDFNETVAAAIHEHWREAAGKPSGVVVVGRRLAARLGKYPRVLVSLDGPSVVEEVQPVLARLMNALNELQTREGRVGPLAVTVFAHYEGEDRLGRRSILPLPKARGEAAHFPYPPLLNLAPSGLFPELARHYLWAQMHDLFYGSLMAENRRRLQHMEGAMQRMEEKTEALQRKYNLLRQEEITEEIEVIMLSSDASISHPRRSQQATVGWAER